MNTKEDFTLSIRSLLASPLESMLLILGLALSIGATASGLGMYVKANIESRALLEQVEYREILVSSSESSDEMSVPISIKSTDEEITLSVADLEAAQVSPNIQYAYLADRSRLRFNTGNGGFDGGREGNNRNNQRENNAGEEGNNNNASSENNERRQRTEQETSEKIEGPLPIIEELSSLDVTPDYFSAMNLNAQSGSLFTIDEINQGKFVIVLGSQAAKKLFEDGIALNRQVSAFNNIYDIVGILQPTGTDIDELAFKPSQLASENARRFRRTGATLHFSVENSADLTQAADQLTQWFEGVYSQGALNISVPREAAQSARERSERIAIITLILALAGLLIANVNVSNILYSRALRRRKQVGILKALGASKNNIFLMFLKESGVLLMIGGLIGVGIAFGFSSIISSGEDQSGLPIYAVLIGILASCFITLAFTLVPAMQASNTPPAIAMRVE